jgi:hypothetical protein
MRERRERRRGERGEREERERGKGKEGEREKRAGILPTPEQEESILDSQWQNPWCVSLSPISSIIFFCTFKKKVRK